jgi:hypothetical protein
VDFAIATLQGALSPEERRSHTRQLAESLAADRSGGVTTWLSQRFERLRAAGVSWTDDSGFAGQHLDSSLHLH